MEQEKEFTGEESLELISRMIATARKDYYDTGISALLWGSVITICSLTSFASYFLRMPELQYIWFLTIAAVIPQVMISIREKKARRYKTHDADLMSGIWISFAISMFLLGWVLNSLGKRVPQMDAIYMIIYGIPTFTTGYARSFKPMIFGGIACWVFALVSLYVDYPYTQLFVAASAQLAWFIPGLILRKRYLKAKRENV